MSMALTCRAIAAWLYLGRTGLAPWARQHSARVSPPLTKLLRGSRTLKHELLPHSGASVGFHNLKHVSLPPSGAFVSFHNLKHCSAVCLRVPTASSRSRC